MRKGLFRNEKSYTSLSAIGKILIDKMFILAFEIKVFSLMQLLQSR